MTLFDKIMARFGQMSIPARANEPMSAHTTFRIGGPARVFCTPNSQVQLAQAIMACRELGLRYYLLGRGSNVLFADEGYEGVVIQIGCWRMYVWRRQRPALRGWSLPMASQAV